MDSETRVSVTKDQKKKTHDSCPTVNLVSEMPTLFCLTHRTSISLGIYPGEPIRRTSLKKLEKGVSAIEAGTKLKNALRGGVHEVKITRVLVHDFGDNGILPELGDRLCNFCREELAAALRIQSVLEHLFDKSLSKKKYSDMAKGTRETRTHPV